LSHKLQATRHKVNYYLSRCSDEWIQKIHSQDSRSLAENETWGLHNASQERHRHDNPLDV